MSWILPTKRDVGIAAMKRAARLRSADRHRPGYYRDYYARNVAKLRPYLAAKAREYRRDE